MKPRCGKKVRSRWFTMEYQGPPQPDGCGGYRIADAADNRVATCYDRDNAILVTSALNQRSQLAPKGKSK